ncbi:MAG: 30S ribosomal protein S21 [Verrucomicrobiota bacterium]
MPQVTVKKGEPVDRALKRLKNKLEMEGIMDEVRRLRAFETPTQKTRRKARAAAKRSRNKFRVNLRMERPDAAESTTKPTED